jgi:hypothetical protein
MGSNSSLGVDFIKMTTILPSCKYDVSITESQSQDQKITYQDFEYCMANTCKFVGYSEHRKIDLQTALNETKNLDWTFLDNGISIINKKTGVCIFFRRVALDKWYVDTPIQLPRFTGLCWASYVDKNTVEAILRLFFEEMDWFCATHWHEAPDLFEVDMEEDLEK